LPTYENQESSEYIQHYGLSAIILS
jgi:hypothetical protein